MAINPVIAITSADMKAYYYKWWDNNPAGRNITCSCITSPWTEGTTTYATRPTFRSIATANTPVPSTFSWMSWDVTADTRVFVNETEVNQGWQLSDLKRWASVNIPITYFYSKEYGSKIPYLEVTLPIHLQGSGSTVAPGGTLNLTLSAASDAGLPYQLASSLGTGPMLIDTRDIKLTLDALLMMSINGLAPSIFSSYSGFLNPQGNAFAAIKVPNNQALLGTTINTAYVTLKNGAPSGIQSISNTFVCTIQ